ncbi:ATP-binding protein [Acuticoccus sp. MNP-M23]|uniref:sensor histidine kinase n=1 Tax=Acuticoccus sp. MNP-M23 TaxID=3072793 RepID=UPI0028169D7F|nr:ATP-binding protein [Acuticoccus sp. MNP-M23]WMS40771.1 ATP-binding protein [Acuticoccus sp. MNP-M23]
MAWRKGAIISTSFGSDTLRRGGAEPAKLRRAAIIAMVVIVALGAASLFVGRFVSQYYDEFARENRLVLNRRADAVEGWLARYRPLAALFARDPRIVDLLVDGSGRGTAAANTLLEPWTHMTGASVVYVLDGTGTTIAASNWDEPVSFVGRNFAYRPYFTAAMDGRLGRYFALGTTSGERGYFFAAPVRNDGRIVGAVVVKVAVDELERLLRLATEQVFVTDAAGIIILAGNPLLRMTARAPLPADEMDRIARTRQFDPARIRNAPIEPASPLWADGHNLVLAPADRGGNPTRRYLELSEPLATEGWTITLLVDTAPVRARLAATTFTAFTGVTLILAIVALVWQRRRLLIERLRAGERDHLHLEERVAARTAELARANSQLEAEIIERREVEADQRKMQAELIQAGKLAALGQMSAALSHEFNQPLTAIRTYSENAIAFYEAGAGDKAAENLNRVQRLTERMAQLSRQLTRFARRSKDTVAPVDLDDALKEALDLLDGRIKGAGAVVTVRGDRNVRVMGGTVRLQHVIMNLVGNAIDAVPPDRAAEIGIDVRRRGAAAILTVEDNGMGISPDNLERIFDPFFTTKEVGKGLGLGLSISYNIIKDFGGHMRAENRSGGGALFELTLVAAEEDRRESVEG